MKHLTTTFLRCFPSAILALALLASTQTAAPVEAHGAFPHGPMHQFLYTVVFDDMPWAARALDDIITCESGWYPYAVGPDNWTGENAIGILQFLPSTFYGVSDGDIWSWQDQMWAARTMVLQGRLNEWVCYTW